MKTPLRTTVAGSHPQGDPIMIGCCRVCGEVVYGDERVIHALQHNEYRVAMGLDVLPEPETP